MPATDATAPINAIKDLNQIEARLSAIDLDLRYLRDLFHGIRDRRDGLDGNHHAATALVHNHQGLVTRMERRLRGLEAWALAVMAGIREASAAGALPELNDLGFDIFHPLDEAEGNGALAGQGTAMLVEPLPEHGNAGFKAVETGVDVVGHGLAPVGQGLGKSAGGGDDLAGRRFSSDGVQA